MTRDNDGTAERLADQIRDLWIHERRRREELLTQKPSTYARHGAVIPRYDGGTDSYGRTYKPLWPQLARHMVMNGINPARLIRFLFSTFEPQGPRDRRVYPTPNMLTSAPLRQKYDDYVANELPKKFEADLDSQARTASLKFRELLRSKSMQYTDEQALRLVLSDLALPLSALYRYCAAADSRHRLQDIRDQFMEPAAVQYLFERDLYDQFWAKYIPVSFVEMVDGVKNSIVGERIRNA